MTEDFFAKISADKNQLGFDYQDLVCLEYLIDLKQGESIGLEVFDDVHHAKISGVKSLVQIKHSVNDKSSLTNSDIDLWKTLYNWSTALEQPNIGDVEFVFFTNKHMTQKDGIVHLLSAEAFDLPKVLNAVASIKQRIDRNVSGKQGRKENPIKKYVDHIWSLSEDKKANLFNRIRMIFSADDIFWRLRRKIEYFSIPEKDALGVLHQLMGIFQEKKYKIVKAGMKVNIDYEMFRKNFQFDRIIQMSLDRKIDFSRYYQYKNVNNIDPKSGLFAKQLTDIGISRIDVTDYAIDYAATSMFIQTLIAGGNFSQIENESIDGELVSAWRSVHRQSYNRPNFDDEDTHNEVARSCLYNLEGMSINVSNSFLVRDMVRGKGMELSDKCLIGWRKDWHDLYGENK